MGWFDSNEGFEEAKKRVQRANELKKAANEAINQQGRKGEAAAAQKLKNLAGNDKEAKKAVEDAFQAAGAKPGLLRRMTGW